MIQGRDAFRSETATESGALRLSVFGELDLVSMPSFEATLDEIRAARPAHLVVDLTRTRFVSVRGFAAIGRLARELGGTSVYSSGALAERILGLLGYDEVESVRAGETS